MNGTPLLIELAYLAASLLFIIGLKRLSSPATARSGNLLAAYGMGIAVAGTLALPGLMHWPLILAMLALGIGLGILGARTVPMTDMPQMVAFLNGLGGGGAAIVSILEFQAAIAMPGHGEPVAVFSGVLGTIIGTLSFVGSVVACGKLTGMLSEKPLQFPGLQLLNAALFAGILGCGAMAIVSAQPALWFYAMLAVSAVFGAMLVLPIGGADMPVVISLLNSFTGLAAAATGFVLGNNALIISGTLVGASGTLLTQLMCKAMNRSIANVLFAGFGGGQPTTAAAGGGKSGPARIVREVTVDDAAMLLANVQSLIIVPGYGMAVAQAQHGVREMADMLSARGVDVKYAIHPVAGRMPGHMNVLLAEANVPYDQLFDLEQINPEFERADVALIIGANDVVNPAARADTTSPIYGMPILDADKAKHVIIIKRSLNAGFAGIDNALYYDPSCSMLFGDAKGAVAKLIEALKAV